LADITQQRIHVNVGIEGNTNHSFLSNLGSIYGPEHVLVYQLGQKEFIRLSDLPQTPSQSILRIGKELLENTPFFNQNSEEKSNIQPNVQTYTRKNLPKDTAAVFGFYTPNFFKGIFENPFISIILKDPLERMISLYESWKGNRGNVDWRKSIPYDVGISFTEFALEEKLMNFQSKCLGNRRLGDFDLVGLAECQGGFIAQLKNKDWTGYINSKTLQIQIDKPKYKNLGINPEFLEEFQALNEMDYSIYQQAKEFIGYC
jgi:hypothetical protein